MATATTSSSATGTTINCGGQAGDDTLDGKHGDDRVYGGDGDDRLYGSNGNDLLDGGPGADMMHGGLGWDDAIYWNSSEAITINLSTNVATGGDAEGDTFVSIEGVSAGSGRRRPHGER